MFSPHLSMGNLLRVIEQQNLKMCDEVRRGVRWGDEHQHCV